MTDYVAFSGGKDSTALALLMPDATPIFTDTGWEFDELYQHIERFQAVTGREVVRITAEETLPQYIERSKFLPNHGARFCTRMFKIDPLNRYLSERLPASLCIGLRADEDANERVGNLTEMNGLTIRYPLREQGIDIWGVIRICTAHDLLPRNLPHMARGGCKGCFYKRRSEVLAMQYLVPEILDELQALEEAVQDERGDFFHMFPNVGKSIADLRAQTTMFDAATMQSVYLDAADTSDKGEACGLFCHR